MTRAEALRSVLDRTLDGVPLAALPELEAEWAASGDVWLLSLIAFARYVGLDYAGAVAAADRAARAAGEDPAADPEGVLMAWTVRGLASAGRRTVAAGEEDSWTATAPGLTPTGDPLRDVFGALDLLPPDTDAAHFIRYLLAEAAVACSRFAFAEQIVARTGELPRFLVGADGMPHPYAETFVVMRGRVLAFRGRTAEAAELLASRADARVPQILRLLLSATESFVRGTTGQRAEVRALADRLELARPAPSDYLSVGCYLLMAWGVRAVGDVRRSARLALFAGPDSLDLLSIVSRGLTLELLVESALDEGDLDAADAWRVRAQPLLGEPIANSSAARLFARVELHAGHAESAAEWATRAAELAAEEGRVIEVAQAEDLLARAHELRRRPRPTGTASSATASSELRARGRQSPVPGSDWDGLSARERDIAIMVAAGLTNREIGVELHLSEHTVRAHVSRVLAAFAAASRFAVAARVAELLPADPIEPRPPLTPRQQAVAECIARGLGNVEIGRELGLSVKTVERHISDILRRWDVSSRVGIARILRAGGQR